MYRNPTYGLQAAAAAPSSDAHSIVDSAFGRGHSIESSLAVQQDVASSSKALRVNPTYGYGQEPPAYASTPLRPPRVSHTADNLPQSPVRNYHQYETVDDTGRTQQLQPELESVYCTVQAAQAQQATSYEQLRENPAYLSSDIARRCETSA